MILNKYYLLFSNFICLNLAFWGFLSTNYKIFAKDFNQEINTEYLRKIPEDFYLLGPGDLLYLSVSEDAFELNQVFLINGEGQTNLKRLKTIYVEGLSVNELTKLLNQEYSKYVKEPDVELKVIGYRAISIYLDGEVENPGVHILPGSTNSRVGFLNIDNKNQSAYQNQAQNLVPNNNLGFINSSELALSNETEVAYFPTLIDALRKSGGFMMNANLEEIKITRNNSLTNGGGRISTSINLLEILDLKDVSKNIRLYDGDTILVEKNEEPIISQISKALKSNINPKYINVFVSGRVANPGTIKINKISTLNDAIALSGGAKILKGPVRFLRYKNDGTIDKRKISLRENAKDGSFNNPFLKEGDIIYVGKSAFNISSEIISEVTSPFQGLITTIGIYRFFNN